jgi:phosphate transport system substrate-binding protein
MRRTLALMALTLVSCSSPVLPASTPTSDAVVLTISATTATMPLLTDLTQSYAQIAGDIRFEITVSNYRSAAQRAIAENPVYFLTTHLPPPEQSTLWGAPIGQDGIAIIAHRNQPIGNLALAQLRDVFQGRVTSWAQLGGDDLPIVVVSREAGSGTRAEFDRLLMGDRLTVQSARIAPSSDAMMRSVAVTPGSIGYVSMSYLDSSVLALSVEDIAPTPANIQNNTYPLRVSLFFAGPGEPEGPLRMFIAWVQSPEGQIVVARHATPLFQP